MRPAARRCMLLHHHCRLSIVPPLTPSLRWRFGSPMCELTDRLNRKWFWLAILAIALAVWGLTDIRSCAKSDPKNLPGHRTDLTVYTTAGAAMFDGRDPYAVHNPRGWHYLYPPLFAILMSPLSLLNSQWQGVIWYAISVATAWGCFTESRRLWCWLNSTMPTKARLPPPPHRRTFFGWPARPFCSRL